MTSTNIIQASSSILIPNASARRRTSPVLAELDREWARLRRRPSALHTVRGWADDGHLGRVIETMRSLDDIVDAAQPRTSSSGVANVIVRRLLELSASDDLAGRILIQRLLPGLISGSGKWGMQPSSLGNSIDVVLGAAWIAIRQFDVNHRSAYIAPALVADALWIGFRRDTRRMQWNEVPVPNDVLAGNPAPPIELEPIPALAGTIRAAARAGVSSVDLDFLRSIIVAGSPSQAARNLEVTARTIRNRRDVAAGKINRALGAEWRDWSDPLIAAA